MSEDTKRWVRIAGITTATVIVAGTLAALLVRDQIHRHQRNLFHGSAIRRMAALEHLSNQQGTIDHLNLLRDYIAWEPRRLLRNRAQALFDRMAGEAEAAGSSGGLPA
jgi:hypothetical protein